MPDDLVQTWVLGPALIATLPGLWLCHRRLYRWGAGLAIIGFVLVGLAAYVAILIGFVSGGAFPAGLAIGAMAALYCAVAAGIALSLGPR